jgi:hypothetical protein
MSISLSGGGVPPVTVAEHEIDPQLQFHVAPLEVTVPAVPEVQRFIMSALANDPHLYGYE